MTATSLDFLTFAPQQNPVCSPKEKERTKREMNEDPRMKEFVKKIVAMQANGNVALVTGNFETEEEYRARRDKILRHKF